MYARRLRPHGWWRWGWRPGRSRYAWHLTFADQPALHDLVAAYQRPLAGLGGLDLVPPAWLHLTVQGVGFTDEVDDRHIRQIVGAAEARCATLAPFSIHIGRPFVGQEGVSLDVRPEEPLRRLRAALRAAIAAVWGVDGVPERPDWFWPRVSIAYSNAPGPAAPVVAAVAAVRAEPVVVSPRSVELIALHRDADTRTYRWNHVAAVPLGSGNLSGSDGVHASGTLLCRPPRYRFTS